MNKHEVLGEIKGFLEGYNQDIKYLVNVETNPRTDIAECVIHEPNQPPRIESIRYKPFMYMKDLSRLGKELYCGMDESYIESKMVKYGVTMEKLETGTQERLMDGYCYKLTSHRSHNDIIQFVKDGGYNPYEKQYDEYGNVVRDERKKMVYKNRDLFYSPRTTEQFFISTQSRLYKGYEQYKEVHRLTFDIETTGLRYQVTRMFAIGVRDNRGFETILEVEKRDDDDSEIKLIQDFFNLIDHIKPAVILGHNSEMFDFDYIFGRAGILKMDMDELPTSLKKGVKYKRRGNTSVKYGNQTDKYTATEMWGYSVIDTLHAAKRTAAVNTELKKTSLKYVAKFENFARENRTYIVGDDGDIGRYYIENKRFLINDINEYVEIPDELQESATKLHKLQIAKENISEQQYTTIRNKFLGENPEFVTWYRENAAEKKLTKFIGGSALVKQYLLDDLWETEQVDELYNQSSFLLAKIVPTTYQRICTMGTASIWNLLLTTWSYENNLAIPIPDVYEHFSGGLARTYKKGYTTRIIKIDYASLYPMIQLTDDIFPIFDITGVMKKMLLYMTTTRNVYKKLAASLELDNEEIELLKEIDYESYEKFINGTLTKEERGLFKVKQLPIKILNNSLFGALGSHISFNWSDNVCAGRITGTARIQLRHAVDWFSQYGCLALLCVTDGINFEIPDLTPFRITDNGIVTEEVEQPLEEMWIYAGRTGIQALIEYFNDTEMPKPYMSVDDDGESNSCLNIMRINYATRTAYTDKKTGVVKNKTKLTGNTIKSKALPEYIEDFIDKGLELILDGKGKEFVDYYYEYAEDIRYMQIPLKKIASKSRVKTTLKGYLKRGTDKNGRQKAMQAHMELLISEREKQALELFEEHKEKLGFGEDKKEPTKIADIMKAVSDYMPPEPELDSTVYYVNTGYVKSHGDSKTIKDKETGEMRFACTLISAEDLRDNPEITGTYNYEKYLAAFNSRVKSLFVGFDPEIAKKIPATVIKKGEHAGELKKAEFNPLSDDLKLGLNDLDDLDESMYLEKNEVSFWNKSGYDPRKIWSGFKLHDDDRVYYEIYEGALKFLNDSLAANGDTRTVKAIDDNHEKGDMVLIKNGKAYKLGMYNGTYMEIIRDDVQIPKSEIELELERVEAEKQKEIDKLEVSELATKSDRELFLEAQAVKLTKYFEPFKKQFGIDAAMTMDDLFASVPEAKGAFDAYIGECERQIDAEANEYLTYDGD